MKPYRSFIYLPIALVLLAGFGCTTNTAKMIPPVSLSQIKIGTTTRADAIKLFGAPEKMSRNQTNTLVVWNNVYFHRLPNSPKNGYARVLSVVFDSNDIAAKKHHSEHPFNVTYNSGHLAIGTLTDEQILKQIKPGTTTKAEVLKLLGEPTYEELDINHSLFLAWVNGMGNLVTSENRLFVLHVRIDRNDLVDDILQTIEYLP